MRSIILLFFGVTGFSSAVAQNLIPNPGFEVYSGCPGGHTERRAEFRVHDWTSANDGTPDHFHECSTGAADVPHNWAGVAQAHEGQGYVGLYMWMSNGRNYREYIQAKLTTPLVKDSLYTIEFHYKLSSYSKYSIDRIGLLLTDSAVRFQKDKAPNVTATFNVIKDSALTETTGLWEKAKWQFRAVGGEQFITLGNFWDDNITHHYNIRFREAQQEMLKDASYYYIDDLQLTPEYSEIQKRLLPEFEVEDVKRNTTYVLRTIQFEFDSYRLFASSFDELDRLAEYLLKNPELTVQLAGHTDDQGSEKYNNTLSRNRARTVAQYLGLQGIAESRIEVSGYGETRPLIAETNEEARKVNRRVEIRFPE
jgi:OmpA-OmpF porin, OOP family